MSRTRENVTSDLNNLVAPWLMPERRVYCVPTEVWKQCQELYKEISIPAQLGEKLAPFTAMRHPNNNYPIVIYTQYIFQDLGV